MADTMPGCSLRAYARRRRCSPESVSRAVKSERLYRSVQRFNGIPRIVDVDLADREWADNTLSHKRPLRQQIRDDEKRQRAANNPFDDPVGIDGLSLMECDEDSMSILVHDPLGNEAFDQFFCVDKDTARWLAGKLLRWANKCERQVDEATTDARSSGCDQG